MTAESATADGYAAQLLATGQGLASKGWLTDAAWVGGLSTAAALAWRGLSAHPLVRLAVTGWLAAESLFFVWSKFRFRHLSRLSDSHPDTSKLDSHFERFLELRDVFCIREFLSGWFMGVPVDTILRGNVEDFVAYGFHCKLLHQLEPPEQQEIRAFVDRVEQAWGFRLRPGYDPELRFMAHVWEPLRAYHKPLALFAITELLARTAHALMFLMGFRPSRAARFTYWHAPPRERSGDGNDAAAGGDDGEFLSPPLSPLGPRLATPSLRRRSTTGEAVHNAAEHALDATLTVTSAAAAVVAAQHPHAGNGPLSPRAPSPVGSLSANGSQPGAARSRADAQAAAAAPVAAASLGRRRNKGDSASEFAGGLGLDAAASSAFGEASTRPSLTVQTQLPAASPSDSAGSGAGGSGGLAAVGGTRRDIPIVFLHGVGFGVLPYLHLVRDIQQACSGTPVLMVEVPHVALRLCWEARGVDDVAHAVAVMLQRHGYRRCCVVGHSYGTFVASRLCQLFPKMVHSAALLDPVSMLTCYPQLLHNFIYREPAASNLRSVGGTVDLLRFMCSRDLTIAQAFCRKFQWSELMLWPQDLPQRSLVVLSGRDDLVPSDLVMAHLKLTGHPATVMHHPDLGHGGILLDTAWQKQFVANLRAMLVVR